jgi:hypothetical protein
MPLTDEFFASNTINVQEFERDLETGVNPHVELQFMAGDSGSGQTMPNGQPDPLYVKRTKIDPKVAVSIGKALIEAGERLTASASVEVVRNVTDLRPV